MQAFSCADACWRVQARDARFWLVMKRFSVRVRRRALPDNIHQVSAFREAVVRLWRGALRRRSRKHRLTWQRMQRLTDRWLPRPRRTHPWPNERFAARTQVKSPVR
jgi:hypothetical protein